MDVLFTVMAVCFPVAIGFYIGGCVAARNKKECAKALNNALMVLWCGLMVWTSYALASWVYDWFKGVL